jgi:hypothetical protein
MVAVDAAAVSSAEGGVVGGAVGGAAAAAALGGVGVARTAGLAARGPDGAGGLTPFLHLRLPSLVPGMPATAMAAESFGLPGRSLAAGGENDEVCAELEQKDLQKCQLDAALYGKSESQRRQIATICRSTAAQRYAECLQGGPDSVRTPLYESRFHTSGRGLTSPERDQPSGRKTPVPRNTSLVNYRRKKP